LVITFISKHTNNKYSWGEIRFTWCGSLRLIFSCLAMSLLELMVTWLYSNRVLLPNSTSQFSMYQWLSQPCSERQGHEWNHFGANNLFIGNSTPFSSLPTCIIGLYATADTNGLSRHLPREHPRKGAPVSIGFVLANFHLLQEVSLLSESIMLLGRHVCRMHRHLVVEFF
jgi:hypothetical protein